MKHWQLIENQPLLRQIYKEPPIISYKRGRSLKDILVKAKLCEECEVTLKPCLKTKIKRPIAVYTIVTVVLLAKLFRLTTQVIPQYAVVSNHKKNTHKEKFSRKKPTPHPTSGPWQESRRASASAVGGAGAHHIFLIVFRCPVDFHSQFRCSQTDRVAYEGQQRFHRK